MIAWMDRHKVFTIILVFAIFALVGAVTVKVFWDPRDVPSGTLGALTVVYGLPALAVALWKWRGELITRKPAKGDE
jgi:hypothetical protein